MFTGSAVHPDRCQHISQQIELIRDKGIHGCEIGASGIQLFLHTIIEKDQVFQDRILAVIEDGQCLISSLSFLQNTFPDHLVHVGRRKRKTGIKAPLNL